MRNPVQAITCFVFSTLLICIVSPTSCEGTDEADVLGVPHRRSLTISIPADGTRIGFHQNRAYKFAEQYMSEKEFYFLVQEAFQEWLKHTDLTIGMVRDENDAMGSPGLHYDDPRFGDIRVGAIPMAGDVLGLGMDHRSPESGTWAGTLLLNSNAAFRDKQHVYQVLLHEAGHVLGLPHNEIPESVMNPDSHLSELSAFDIESIQLLYSTRQLDPNEDADENNDSVLNPTRLRVHGSDEGTIPAFAFGDLGGNQDEDWFEMDVLAGYEGKVTISLIVSGISFLEATVEVYDENLALIGKSVGRSGENLSVTLPAAAIGETAMIRILSNSEIFDFGVYAVLGRFEENMTVSVSKIAEAAHGRNLYWDQNDSRDYFNEEGTYFYHPDGHLNDTLATAVELEESHQPGNFEVHESIFDLTDRDFFFLDAPDQPDAAIMTIGLTSFDFGEMIPYIRVFDEDGNSLNQNVIVNGSGTWVSQLVVKPNRRYFVSIEGGVYSNEGFRLGNYQLNVRWHLPQIEMTRFARGRLTDNNRSQSHSVHVAKTQMFHLNLFANTKFASQKSDATIWVTIYNEKAIPVFQIATRPGETRSNGSVLLSPGSYRVQFDLTYDGQIGALQYQLNGRPNSKSEGPELLDPSNSPFPPCGENQTGYCYPDNNESENPFIWIDGVTTNLPQDPLPPPGWRSTDELYWPEVTLA